MRFRRLLLTTALLLPGFVSAELVPAETFAAGYALSQARLSPDGKYFAFIQQTDDGSRLKIVNLETKTVAMADPEQTPDGMKREITSFRWIGTERLSFITTVMNGGAYTGLHAVNRDGKKWRAYTGFEASPGDSHALLSTQIIYAFDDAEQNVLMLEQRLTGARSALFPNVVKVSSLTADSKTVVENPGNVVNWVVDQQGNVRVGVTREGNRYGAIYRETSGAPWRTLPLFNENLGRVTPLGFDFDGRRLVIATSNAQNRRAIYFYDLVEGKLGNLIAEHAEYDIIPEFGSPRVDGLALSAVVSSELTQATVGFRFMTEGPQMQWFDPHLVSVQAAIDQALPNTVNLIASRSRDEKRMIVLAYSDRDPGTYYLLDLNGEKPVFARLGAQVPDFPVDRLAPMFPIAYKARDGVRIHGYLTLPLGDKKTGLPLIVMPHGGPNVRDVWGYDANVQFLASRGYAVLQMNYRGSPGYGAEFYDRGKREIGRGMQTDIDDGTRWAIAQGVADPARIAIVGASFGGYSALFALGQSPELYRCGISVCGVTDWAEISKGANLEEFKFAYMHFQEWIGDPKLDAQFLASISPVNFAAKIKAPVLIVHGKEDQTVPPRQARRMVEALEKAGHKPETLYLAGEGHGFRKEKNRLKALREMETFLAKNLAPAAN